MREFSFENRVDDIRDEDGILDCVRRGLLRHRPNQRVVSFEEFSRVAFPSLRRESVPRRPEYLSAMFESAEFRETVEPLDLRFVVFIGGVVETAEPDGWIICGAGPGPAGGCFGYVRWDKTSRMGATVLDLKEMRSAERVEAHASGKAWLALIGVLPIGNPLDPSTNACDDLGSMVARHLDGIGEAGSG